MLTDWLNITRIAVTGAERLYPRGLDWRLTPGVNAIVGGTGLGKTTLVYAAQFGIFGKLLIDGDRIERDFFRDRLTKRTGQALAKNQPCVRVEFTAGGAGFVVERNLLTGVLVAATCDGKPLKGAQWEQKIAGSVGLGGDFSSVARLQEHLFFFGEGRYLLAWENLVQHELVNLLMSDHASYVRLADLWAKVESADSEARNISSQAYRFQKDLEELQSLAEKPVKVLARRSETHARVSSKQELEQDLARTHKQLGEEIRLEETLSGRISTAYDSFHQQLAVLESEESADLDQTLLAEALADPTIASVRVALAKFYATPNDRTCPCCSRPGLERTVAAHAVAAVTSARQGNCIVCSKTLPAQRTELKAVPVSTQEKETGQRAGTLQGLLFQREQVRSRISLLREDEGRVSTALARVQEEELEDMRKNPASVAQTLEGAIKQMREREKRAREVCNKEMAALKKELGKTNAVFSKISANIAKAFTKYANLYLDEPCDVAFLKEGDLPSKRGPQVKAPHAAFFPVISGETRPSAQALSDAQRSFVDLAFRMAVVEVWHKQTKKTVTLFVETPEGAVDIAYMERVAKMLRTFGQQGHTMVITTNLNNDIFLPEVMALRPKSQRTTSVLNLLEEGNPRPVQRAHHKRFDRILRLVATHSVAK